MVNSKRGPLARYFRAQTLKIAIVAHCILIVDLLAGNAQQYERISIISGLNFVDAVVAFQVFEITRTYEKILTLNSSRSFKVIDLDAKPIDIAYMQLPIRLAINNFERIPYRFRDIDKYS